MLKKNKPIETTETHHEGGPYDPCDKGENRRRDDPMPGQVLTDHEKDLAQCALGKSDGQIDLEPSKLMPGQQHDEDMADINSEVIDNMPRRKTPEELLEQLLTESGLHFKGIMDEKYREYIYADSSDRYHIDNPIALHVSASGGHRVLDGRGLSHYIAPGWRAIQWRSTNTGFSF